MESTNKSVIDTCAEMEKLLAENGATTILKKFKNGQVEGLQFIMPHQRRDIPFKIVFKWEAIQKLAKNGQTGYKKTSTEDQARKVAARLELRYIQSLFSKIDIGMADLLEVLLPYVNGQ